MSIQKLTSKEKASFLSIAIHIMCSENEQREQSRAAIDQYFLEMNMNNVKYNPSKFNIADELSNFKRLDHKRVLLVEIAAFVYICTQNRQLVNEALAYISEVFGLASYARESEKLFWLKSPHLSEIAQQQLVNLGEQIVRQALAKNPKLSRHLQLEFTKDKLGVRQSLAESYYLDIETQCRLSNDSYYKVRCILASNYYVNEEIKFKLVTDKDFRVRCYTARNSSLTHASQLKLTHDESKVRQFLAANKFLYENIQKKLAFDDDLRVRCQLAQNSKLTKVMQLQLLNDEVQVRKCLAENPYLHEEPLSKLSEDVLSVRLSLINNPKYRKNDA